MTISTEKTNHVLPAHVATTFANIENTNERNAYIAALRDTGWTLQSIAAVTGLTRERARQIHKDTRSERLPNLHPVPAVPTREVKASPVYIEPSAEGLAEMLALKPAAAAARQAASKNYAAGQRMNELIGREHHVNGVSVYRLALRLEYTHAAVRSRLRAFDRAMKSEVAA